MARIKNGGRWGKNLKFSIKDRKEESPSDLINF